MFKWFWTTLSLGAPEESITLSMELAKTQSHEFECFEDNYSLTISTQGCRITTRKFNTNGISYGFRELVNTEPENRPSSPLTKDSSPARGKKLSSSKELAWNLYTV